MRTILWALLIAFVVGLVIGTLIRRQVERPTYYMGQIDRREDDEPMRPFATRPALNTAAPASVESVGAPGPGDVRDAEPSILMASHHEEQVG